MCVLDAGGHPDGFVQAVRHDRLSPRSLAFRRTSFRRAPPLDLLGKCEDTTTVCVPDDYTKTYDRFLPKKCASLEGAEGRCISTCIPQVNGLMDVLPKADCGDDERCAPCINPNDGTDTHACSQGCDTGPSKDTTATPITFDKCGNGLGVCVRQGDRAAGAAHRASRRYVHEDGLRLRAGREDAEPEYNFQQCTPVNAFVTVLESPRAAPEERQQGGCVPQYLADANPIEGVFLTADGCKTGEKCAPCDNPLRGNTPTGACPVSLPSDDGGGLPPAPPMASSGTPPPTTPTTDAGVPPTSAPMTAPSSTVMP